MEHNKNCYFVDANTVIVSENYMSVALKNLGYDLETILNITCEVDRLYEEEEPEIIEKKFKNITGSVYGKKTNFINQPYKMGRKYDKKIWWKDLKIALIF